MEFSEHQDALVALQAQQRSRIFIQEGALVSPLWHSTPECQSSLHFLRRTCPSQHQENRSDNDECLVIDLGKLEQQSSQRIPALSLLARSGKRTTVGNGLVSTANLQSYNVHVQLTN